MISSWHLWSAIFAAFLSLKGLPALAQGVDEQTLENAAIEIRKKNRNISEALLARDRFVIEAAYPNIKENLSMKGFTSAEVNHAVITSWKKTRLEAFGAQLLNEQTFKTQVSRLGMLQIESEPREATIEIDANAQEDRTNMKTWLAPGTYRIVLSKPEYFPAEEYRTIVEGKNPPLKLRLKPRLK